MNCPNCGTISSKFTTSTCPKCGRYLGRSSKSYGYDVFTTAKRTPNNGGYTQQNAKETSQNYTGLTPADGIDDGTFFSEKNINKPDTNEDEFIDISHNPENNPYDTKVYTEPRNTDVNSNAHSTEFVANDIVEFSKHRFGRDIANKILFMLIGLIGSGLIGLFFDFFIDETHITRPMIITHTIVVIMLSITLIKTYRPAITLTLLGITLIYMLPMFVILCKTHIVLNGRANTSAAELLFIYVPIITQLILCKKLNKAIINYNDHWDAYNNRGVYINKDEVIDDYKFFNSGNNKD